MSLALTRFLVVFSLYLGAVFCEDIRRTYRTDYVYTAITDAFYKIHLETHDHIVAQRRCEMEGAELATLTSFDDIAFIRYMRLDFPDIDSDMWVKEDGTPHEPANEPYILSDKSTEEETDPPMLDPVGEMIARQCDVVTKDGDVRTARCISSLPFVCKVDAKNAPYDSVCDVYGKGYIRGESVGSCYKILSQRLIWNEAYAECKAERAHLVILNSDDERSFIVNKLHSLEAPSQYIRYFAGGRAFATNDGTPKVMKTIFNQTLEDAGFNTWTSHQWVPVIDDERDTCLAVMETDGYYIGLECNQQYSAICEKEIPAAPVT